MPPTLSIRKDKLLPTSQKCLFGPEKNSHPADTRITIAVFTFYFWIPTLTSLLPEANSQKARTAPNLLNSMPQRSESGDFYMHIYYAHTVFDMINCQEYIIAVSGC